MIVAVDDKSSAVFTHAVAHKGVDHGQAANVASLCARDIEGLAYRRIEFRADQEPSIQAFLGAVQEKMSTTEVLKAPCTSRRLLIEWCGRARSPDC